MNDRKRLLIMLPILAVAAWLAFFGDKAPTVKNEDVIAAAAPSRSAGVQASGALDSTVMATAPVAVVSPGAPRQRIKQALQETQPGNLFASNAPPPPPPPVVVRPEDIPPPPPHFIVIGSAIQDGHFSVFLDKDNQTYVAKPGVVIDGNRVDVVKSDEVKLFNLSTKTTQIIPIEGDK